MQDKTEFKFEFKNLPQEINDVIAQHLPTRDLLNQVLVSKADTASFFQPTLDVRTFLHHVVCGEHDKVRAMLEKDIHLLYKRGEVTDCSGREFKLINDKGMEAREKKGSLISGFEYALWALDKDLWTLMLDCIPKNGEGKKVLERLLTQYEKLKVNGVSYSIDGQAITEQHFDFKGTIITELQTQVDSLNAPGPKDGNAIDKQWRNGVGRAQRLVPLHVVHWYCCKIPFHPIPNFAEQQPTLVKQFWNYPTKIHEDWFAQCTKLGEDFAVYKGTHSWAQAAAGAVRVIVASYDLVALKALCVARTNDFINLNQQLEKQLLVHNQPMGFQI
mgnify:CR=1 FL=1